MPIVNGETHPEQINKYDDSIRFLIVTAAVYLIVKDSLGHVFREDINDLSRFIKFHRYDVNANDPLENLLSNIFFNQYISLHELEKVILIRVKAKEEGIDDNVRIIGRCCFQMCFIINLKLVLLFCLIM